MALPTERLKHLIEAALLVAGRPLGVSELKGSVLADYPVTPRYVQLLLAELKADYEGRGVELKEVASGWRFQARQEYAEELARLWSERAPRYSRAVMETLTLIAYRQPITRAEIEAIRGVAVSTQIVTTLKERGWVRGIGHKEVPGRPELLATTREFLDYFNLKSLDQLPELDEVGTPLSASLAESVQQSGKPDE
ncbi:SMC-Scp complex subunit ScpB [Aeromonas simiae]|uniref:SMC-Scp complex subunit ScpB n=1 Tax=Aeromonas simiae TaxID=218936 RepID=UPI0005A672D0|nr:SMC-Scp complex subunit ScpB [Aeromonas simiae]MDO2949853.1 SMC-Scp complex subunit ScpB [Aeromonas simiae]MDO2953504.1 SMC-Scp complex subunit ScpB [Aeromonas simiae]MDO2957184.1 SMC-Scp complex subunit ScpB [Aeromonas simiae]